MYEEDQTQNFKPGRTSYTLFLLSHIFYKL